VTTATLARSDIRVFRATAAEIAGTWGRALDGLGEARLAHAVEWFTVIRNSYGHDPLYLHAEGGDGRRGVLPAFIVRRPVGGTVVSSMPFLDSGGPCSSSVALADALVARLIEEARGLGAAVVELRGIHRLGITSEPMEHKVNLTLLLPGDAARLWQQLDGSVRNQIRKAERSGLSVEFGGGEKLDDFYAIFATRMRELGSPVHARRFFTAIFDAFGGQARVALVRNGATPIGGLITLAFNGILVVPWASCLHQYRALCPNMLLYWETMRTACVEGFRRFDFGRSSRGSGTYRFKRQWGAGEEPLFWYTIPLSRRARGPRPSAGRRAAFLAGSWRHLPLAVTRHLGPCVRKYLTQ
jgi:FemAB-related protein (PEP-CTERM system-associated)